MEPVQAVLELVQEEEELPQPVQQEEAVELDDDFPDFPVAMEPVQAVLELVQEEEELPQPVQQEEAVELDDDFPDFPVAMEPVQAVEAYFPLDKVALDLARFVNADPTKAAVEWKEEDEKNIVELYHFIPAADSDFALVLALLTNNAGIARLNLSSERLSLDRLTEAITEHMQRLRRQAVVAPEKILLQFDTLPTKIDFIPGNIIPDFMSNFEGFVVLLNQRPNLGLAVRACYDRELDLPPLLARLDEAKEMEFPDDALMDLAQDRAAYIQHHLVENLGLPAERIVIQEGSACGHQVDLLPLAAW
jgi:hypothetical protein